MSTDLFSIELSYGEPQPSDLKVIQQRVKPKVLVEHLLGGVYGKVSVRKGRGTSRSWLYIATANSVPESARRLVEHHLVNAGHCGQYWPELSYQMEPNILWELL